MRRLPTLTLLTVAAVLVACDRGPSKEEAAQDRYALELADCAAYYAVIADCVPVKSDTDRAKVAQTKMLALKAVRMSTELSSSEVARARVDRAIDRNNETLEKQCRNPEKLLREFGDICVQAVDDPQGRASYWLETVE